MQFNTLQLLKNYVHIEYRIGRTTQRLEINYAYLFKHSLELHISRLQLLVSFFESHTLGLDSNHDLVVHDDVNLQPSDRGWTERIDR